MKLTRDENKYLIKKLLKKSGVFGSVSLLNGNTRNIMHSPRLHRPLRVLPFPLSILQRRIFVFDVWEEDENETHLFDEEYKFGTEMDVGIDKFLEGLTEDEVSKIHVSEG